jgi:hypothetical protein
VVAFQGSPPRLHARSQSCGGAVSGVNGYTLRMVTDPRSSNVDAPVIVVGGGIAGVACARQIVAGGCPSSSGTEAVESAAAWPS